LVFDWAPSVQIAERWDEMTDLVVEKICRNEDNLSVLSIQCVDIGALKSIIDNQLSIVLFEEDPGRSEAGEIRKGKAT